VQLERELERHTRLGIGLAAPQIGIPKRIAIVKVSDDLKVTLVNCKIAAAFDSFIFDAEGCLSFPDRHERTQRYREIYVTDNAVEPHSFVATDLFAVAAQHELNHLDGVLLPDLAIVRKGRKKKRRG
jgi:peptide deformylase